MSFARYIKELDVGRADGGDLSFEDAHQLYGAMLDGGIPDLELGALLISLRIKTESLSELLGFYEAVSERLYKLSVGSPKLRPVVLGSYDGAKLQPNLLPLLALLLQRFGVPVLIHGTLEGHGRVATAYILRELGITPATSLVQARLTLEMGQVVFVPTAVFSPGLAALLSLRNRLGVRNSSHILAKLIDPLDGHSFRVVGVTHPGSLNVVREFFRETGARALLLSSTDGEAFADPRRRPELEYFSEGESHVLFEAELGPPRCQLTLPEGIDAANTARWIRQALSGEIPLPLPIVNQLACCLYGAGYTPDVNQAKAIVAFETGSLG